MDPEIFLADFFSGCGGTSSGFQAAGIKPVLALDHDADSASSYALNFPSARVMTRDICDVDVDEVATALVSTRPGVRLFAGCAPCQPFSIQQKRRRKDDIRAPLLLEFLKFVRELAPELVFVENVPGMQRLSADYGPFTEFVDALKTDYHVNYAIVSSADYGVPQRRKRLVLLASRLGPIGFPSATHGPSVGVPFSTVQDWIHGQPALKAGERSASDPIHRASALSALNLQRIQATPEGGDRRNWPPDLLPECHRNGFKGHTDVYGRLSWDRPAPALTTRCISYSNGRFGHPDQDRAVSVREAALLQTFPPDFQFAGSMISQAKQVGNAVPASLAEVFGNHLLTHVRKCTRE